MSEPTHYQVMRSRNNTHLFVICYADRFYDDVPLAVRNRGPWAGDRGLVQNLRPEIRLTLRARATWWSRRRRLCSTRRRRAASKKDAELRGEVELASATRHPRVQTARRTGTPAPDGNPEAFSRTVIVWLSQCRTKMAPEDRGQGGTVQLCKQSAPGLAPQ